MSAGQIAPSRILRKLAAYPRQNDLAAALREVGRIERTLFIIEWILDTGMQRRAQVGLRAFSGRPESKGDSHGRADLIHGAGWMEAGIDGQAVVDGSTIASAGRG
ncbi:hypothetical protein ABIC44_003894 [Sphingomonas sp. 1185]